MIELYNTNLLDLSLELVLLPQQLRLGCSSNHAKGELMKLIERDRLVALLIDVQEKLVPAMAQGEVLLNNCEKLLSGLERLNIPLLISEQYPKGLGSTHVNLAKFKSRATVIEKTCFSCMENPDFVQALKNSGKKQVLIFGIETHVCLLQTVFQLLENGYEVFVACEAVSSRSEKNRDLALSRMTQSGAQMVTTESVFFEILRNTSATEFKDISKLVR